MCGATAQEEIKATALGMEQPQLSQTGMDMISAQLINMESKFGDRFTFMEEQIGCIMQLLAYNMNRGNGNESQVIEVPQFVFKQVPLDSASWSAPSGLLPCETNNLQYCHQGQEEKVHFQLPCNMPVDDEELKSTSISETCSVSECGSPYFPDDGHVSAAQFDVQHAPVLEQSTVLERATSCTIDDFRATNAKKEESSDVLTRSMSEGRKPSKNCRMPSKGKQGRIPSKSKCEQSKVRSNEFEDDEELFASLDAKVAWAQRLQERLTATRNVLSGFVKGGCNIVVNQKKSKLSSKTGARSDSAKVNDVASQELERVPLPRYARVRDSEIEFWMKLLHSTESVYFWVAFLIILVAISCRPLFLVLQK